MKLRVFVYEYLSGGGSAQRLKGDAFVDSDFNGADEDDAAELLVAGLAMRDAVVADLSTLPGVSLSYACAVPDVRYGPASPQATPVYPMLMESATSFVKREAALHDLAWIIAPETDELLLQLCSVVEPSKWVGCDAQTIELCGRKRATVARLAALGLPTPLAFDAQATRWVVKPDDGAGCLHTTLHDTRVSAQADLHARRMRGETATLEPWVEGPSLSLSLLCEGGTGEGQGVGIRLLSINRQQIELQRDGSLRDAGVVVGGAEVTAEQVRGLRLLARQVVHALPGLRGFVGIDLVWHPQRGPVVIEVNPRLTCSYAGLSALLGRNLAADVLRLHGADIAGQAPLRFESETADAAP